MQICRFLQVTEGGIGLEEPPKSDYWPICYDFTLRYSINSLAVVWLHWICEQEVKGFEMELLFILFCVCTQCLYSLVKGSYKIFVVAIRTKGHKTLFWCSRDWLQIWPLSFPRSWELHTVIQLFVQQASTDKLVKGLGAASPVQVINCILSHIQTFWFLYSHL